MEYHFCSNCKMFTGKEKEECLYCGADLKKPKRHSIRVQILSSLRLLRINPKWQMRSSASWLSINQQATSKVKT